MKTVLHGFWSLHSSEVKEAKELWRLREAKAKPEELKTVQNKLTIRLLKLQDELGVDILSDGGFRWDSSLDIAKNLKGLAGFEVLHRVGVTNHFHRTPVVEAMPTWQSPIFVSDFIFANAATLRPVMVNLPGPYTLARQSLNSQGESSFNKDLALAYAGALNLEIKSLLEANVPYVKIDDSAILRHPEDSDLVQEACGVLTAKLDRSRIYFHTSDLPVSNFPRYFDLPFGGFFLDFASSKKIQDENVMALQSLPKDCILGAGLINATRSYFPPTGELLELLAVLNKPVPLERMLLCPNTDLDFLPWNIAVEKVKQLISLAKTIKLARELR